MTEIKPKPTVSFFTFSTVIAPQLGFFFKFVFAYMTEINPNPTVSFFILSTVIAPQLVFVF